MSDTDETTPKPVKKPGAGKGTAHHWSEGDKERYDDGHDRIFGWPVCNECGEKFWFDPDEPFAFCGCGISEWGAAGRPENYEEIQKGFIDDSQT